MKFKQGFMLRQIAGSWIVVPVGQRVVDFNGLMTLSETGAFLWKRIEERETEDELLTAVLEEYEVDVEVARTDMAEFLGLLRESGVLE